MDAAVPILLFVLVAAAFIGLAAYAAYLRRKQWQALADRHGFRATEGDPLDLRATEPGFALFDLGHSRRVLRTMEGGRDGVPITVFDYRYTTGGGKHQSTHSLTAMMAGLPIHCPHLRIRPEHFGDRIASAFGVDDIDFEYEEFNKRFHVSGIDKRFAYDVCHPEMIEHLLGGPEFCWELLGGRLLAYSHRLSTFDDEEFERSLRLLEGFVARIPAYLRRS